MRVLIVNAYPVSSKSGREHFNRFRRHVTCVVRDLQNTEVTQVEIVEKHRSNLDSFLFEAQSEFADPDNITNFDQLDFVFVDGDANCSPWGPSMRKLLILTKMCMMTGKCFFGSGIGASLLAFICATGGKHLQILNNDGTKSMLERLQGIRIPSQESKRVGSVSNCDQATPVLLDINSGDFFVYVERELVWAPKGNTGLVLHSSDNEHCYGARLNFARAGSKEKNAAKISEPLYLAKQGEVRCCLRLEVANQHPIIMMTFPRLRELILLCKSKWDVDQKIATTSDNKYRVLIDSSRGPMLLEFGHCFGSHFVMDDEYQKSVDLLRNFTKVKYNELRVHKHIDPSYSTIISRTSRFISPAQNKGTANTRVTRNNIKRPSNTFAYLATEHEGVIVGKSFSKRCRPASAGPFWLKPRGTCSRRNQTSSLAHLPPTGRVSLKENNTRDILSVQNRWREVKVCKEIHAEMLKWSQPMPPRVVRVFQKNEVEKPYCAQHRFIMMRKEEKEQGAGFYSVVNDAPYTSVYEQEAVDKQRSKQRWIGGPFRTAIGKASMQVVPEVSIFLNDSSV
ncbi:hypothetical protein Plhal710r2_c031g0114101 [Plasmopara halstedii]